MKSKLFLILIIIVGNNFISQAQFAGGKGTSESPWLVSTIEHLDSVRHFLSDTFLLVNDIDLQGSKFDSTNSSTGWLPISANFKGYFNGSGYIIHNLYINRPSTDNVGLFSSVYEGTIDSLSLKKCQIQGNSYVGGIVGSLYSGQLSNCSSSGTVSGVYERIGGLIGHAQSSYVSNCYSKGMVITGDVYNKYIGGVIGVAWKTNISDCFSYSNVSGDDDIGGIVGYMLESNLELCFSTGNIVGNEMVGGIVGSGSISRCYSTSNVVGVSGPVGGLVGYGLANNSYFTGHVKGYEVSGFFINNVGGIVGSNTSTVINCYSACKLTYSGDTRAGSIVGSNDATVIDCYFNKDLSNASAYPGSDNVYGVKAYPLSTLDMKDPSIMDKLFENKYWSIRVDSTFPALTEISNNAPFSFNDTILMNTNSVSISRILENDFDFETIQDSLVYRIDEIYGSIVIDNENFIIPDNAGVSYRDSLLYTVGEKTADKDTLWGNQSKVFLYKTGAITSITELHTDSQVKVYPNPALNEINIASSVPVQSIRIIDVSGKVLITQNKGGVLLFSLDVVRLKRGVYMVQTFTDNEKIFYNKIVKK